MEPPSAPPIITPAPTPQSQPPISTVVTAAVVQPPPPPPAIVAPTTYPESLDSSPRSRATDIDDPAAPGAAANGGMTSKLRLMCSYGGHIVPRPHDKSLCYAGGDTRIVVVDRGSPLSDILSRLSKTLLNGRPFTLKYQLPNEDLDSLITVSTEEDLENMIDEYDRLVNGSNPARPSRIRLFLFPQKPEGAASIGPILEGSNRSEDWFLNALNGSIQRGFSDPTSVNCLLGLDERDGVSIANSNNNSNSNPEVKESMEFPNGGGEGKLGNTNTNTRAATTNQDVHSVPDSPIIETTSSFGSTSSSPSLANLPPIRVHVEEQQQKYAQQVQGGGGIEEQFAQMGITTGTSAAASNNNNNINNSNNVAPQQQQQVMNFVDDGMGGFVNLSPPAPPPVVVTGVPAGGDFVSRVFSDDERSDHGGGYRKQQQQQGAGMGQQVIGQQQPQKQLGGGELASPDSVSSDSSLSNAIARQKTVIYQDSVAQLSSGSNRLPQNLVDPNTRIQLQQVSETGYVLPPQYDQHQQFLQQQQQQQTQVQPQTQQQYIPSGAHFVPHPPPGAVPMSSYYPVYPSQQPHHLSHQYPVYYVPAGQAQAYNLPVQQQPTMGETTSSIPSSRPQNPPNPTIITTSSAYNQTRNVPPPKPEMSGVYRTGPAGAPQLIQVPSNQHQAQSQAQPQAPQQQQFMGYSQIHHPSQSMASNPDGTAPAYAYEFADPAHGQMYYAQPLPPNLAAQYQGVSSGATMVLADGSSQLPNENLKQQIRSSQPV